MLRGRGRSWASACPPPVGPSPSRGQPESGPGPSAESWSTSTHSFGDVLARARHVGPRRAAPVGEFVRRRPRRIWAVRLAEHADAVALRERTCDAAAWAPTCHRRRARAGRAGASRRRCAHTIAQGRGQPWNPQRTALPAATRRSFAVAIVLTGLTFVRAPGARWDSGHDRAEPTMVLVHGAWADASSWAESSSEAHDDGFTIAAVPNPLRSLSATRRSGRLPKTLTGPVVLVGHSTAARSSPRRPAIPGVQALVRRRAGPRPGRDAAGQPDRPEVGHASLARAAT
jgi:hypothetical protein